MTFSQIYLSKANLDLIVTQIRILFNPLQYYIRYHIQGASNVEINVAGFLEIIKLHS